MSITTRGIYGDPLIGAPLPAGYHPGDIIVDATGGVPGFSVLTGPALAPVPVYVDPAALARFLAVSVSRIHLGGTSVELVATVLDAAGAPVPNAVVLFAVRASAALTTHALGGLGASYWVSHAAGVGVVETMGGCSTTNGVGAASIVCGVSVAGQAGDVLVTALVPGSGAGTLAFSFDP